MLKNLVLKNIALIDYAELEFSAGLNVLSGETGAGKSVILDSLNFVLGAKADKSMIRHGEDECFVQAVFDMPTEGELKAILSEYGVQDDDSLIISRKYDIFGKGSIKINGMTVTAGMLREISLNLVDVHGQSEHFFLLKEANQLSCLDKFCKGADKIKARLADLTSEYKSVKKKLESLGMSDDDRERKTDILKFQTEEIENAAIKEGEEEELITARKKILSSEKIIGAFQTAAAYLCEEEGCLDILRKASKELEQVIAFDSEYEKAHARIEECRLELDDLGETVKDLLSALDFDEQEAKNVEERLDTIKNIKKKYGATQKEIDEFYQKAKLEYETLLNYTELSGKYNKELIILQDEIFERCKELSRQRKESAELLSANVMAELKELGMKNARFSIEFDGYGKEDAARATSNGLDNIRFMFSANLGEPVKELSKIISGGEMSRFMLALKTQISKDNDIQTFIFDEIDAGISGVTAKIVAEKFAGISAHTQIIAISHLAQICAMSDSQLLIEKHETADKTVTSVKMLDKREKIIEIARLLGGDTKSSLALEHAEKLIGESQSYKTNAKKTG